MRARSSPAPPAATPPGTWERGFTSGDPALGQLVEALATLRLVHFAPHLRAPCLEIGPGSGELARRAGVTHVLDVSDEMLRWLAERHPALSCARHVSLPLPYADGAFRTVIACDVLHHVKETTPLADFCGEIARILEPGGTFLVSDRRPTLLNRTVMGVCATGRAIAVGMRPDLPTMGSPVELPMTAEDYRAVEAPFERVGCAPARPLSFFLLSSAGQLCRAFGLSDAGFGRLLALALAAGARLPAPQLDQILVLKKRATPAGASRAGAGSGR